VPLPAAGAPKKLIRLEEEGMHTNENVVSSGFHGLAFDSTMKLGYKLVIWNEFEIHGTKKGVYIYFGFEREDFQKSIYLFEIKFLMLLMR